MKSILIFGAGGGLGRTLSKFFETKGLLVKTLTHQEGDVTNEKSVATLIEQNQPEWVINTSGYTAVDKAETDQAQAFKVNAEAPGILQRVCEQQDTGFITYSTDYVFSGESIGRPWKESDVTEPKCVYGLSKLYGEQEALKYHKSLVIRTSWLYSETGKSFPRTILTRCKNNEPLRIVDDQISSPTFSLDLAEATFQLMSQKTTGLIHFSGEGAASWFQFASRAIEFYNEIGGTSWNAPEAIATKELNLPARRPAYSLLDTSLAKGLGIRVRPWDVALRDFIERIVKARSL